jgi:hypothetical protein
VTEGPLGRFLELALPAPDLLATWHALHGLGFAEATTTDARPNGYAAFSDGRMALGLHQQGCSEIELVFVRPGLQAAATALLAAGLEPTEQRLSEDSAHELAFRLPGGPAVRLLEARTFSPPLVTTAFATGWFVELMLPCPHPQATAQALEGLGFVCLGEEALPLPHLALTSDTVNLGLYQHPALARPGLLFQTNDLTALQLAVERAGLDPQPSPAGLHADVLCLRLPEGTPLWVMRES